DLIGRPKLTLRFLPLQRFRDGCRQSCLAVIPVPARSDVLVRLAAIKFLFAHFSLSSSQETAAQVPPLDKTIYLPLPAPSQLLLQQCCAALDRNARNASSKWRGLASPNASQSCNQTSLRAARTQC